MNYGFFDSALNKDLRLEEKDEINRVCIQLYHQLASSVNLGGKTALEIGCGFGGGASYVMRYLRPKSMTAVDANDRSVAAALRMPAVSGLRFQVGDSEKLPFKNGCFDVVLNVESSHCYASMKRFLKEVYRVLRPGGHFLFCDFRHKNTIDSLKNDLLKCGLKIIKEDDITAKVLDSLDQLSDSRERLLGSVEQGPLRSLMREFAALRDTEVYNSFKTRKYIYMNYVLRKSEIF